ncbi:hypothetical protein [Kribbella sp. NPDC004875]
MPSGAGVRDDASKAAGFEVVQVDYVVGGTKYRATASIALELKDKCF